MNKVERKALSAAGGGGGGGTGGSDWGTPIWNRRECSSEILNLTPKGGHLGVAQAFCDPKRRPIWKVVITTF